MAVDRTAELDYGKTEHYLQRALELYRRVFAWIDADAVRRAAPRCWRSQFERFWM